MKPVEPTSTRQLLQIVPDHPTIRMLHFTDMYAADLPEQIGTFCVQRSYEYQINCLDEHAYERWYTYYADRPAVTPVKFTLQRPRYMIQGKLFDYVFIDATIAEEIRADFLQKVHPIIKNGGNILILLPKEDRMQRYTWMALLEEHYYVATSTINDLYAHYDVLISKKMHGWGG